MKICSWNVLHRIHANNWGEGVIAGWVRERERVDDIARRIAALDADVICLQEVSGDQLAALRRYATAVELFELTYPRVPRRRVEVEPPSDVDDARELLVTLVRSPHRARIERATAFADDPGKGLLAVTVGDLVVVNVHITYGAARQGQLAIVGQLARAHARTVICGDFNADAPTVLRDLGDGFSHARPGADAPPTRPRSKPSDKSSVIDHVVMRGGQLTACEVVDVSGQSDHNLITASISPSTT